MFYVNHRFPQTFANGNEDERSRHERRLADTEENASRAGWRAVKRDA